MLAIVAGPPWWGHAHLVEAAFVLMILVVAAVSSIFRAEHWRMSAVVEERSRMAREIHDTLAQSFCRHRPATGVRLAWTALRGRERPVSMALQMAAQSRREAHRFHRSGSAPCIPTSRLENMLRKVLRQQVSETHVELSVSSQGTPERLTGEAEGQVLRVAQEGVANAIQHARPTRIAVRLRFDDRKFEMEIEDDGPRF